LIGRTSHRGTSQDKGEGEDETDRPHLTVSGCPWPAAPGVSFDNRRLFPDICAKNGKWFHQAGELFRRHFRTKQWPEKFNEFSHDALSLGRFGLNTASWPLGPLGLSSHGRRRASFTG
jgi:hypothetical protein